MKFISLLVTLSLLFVFLATPITAIEVVPVNTTNTVSVVVNGTRFDVTISSNADGTQTVTVLGGEEPLSWTVKAPSEEMLSPSAESVTGSYGEYRYIYNSDAASVWNLYRPLQSDGGAWAKGVPYDSDYCRAYAHEIESMNDADDRVRFYLEGNDLASGLGAQMFLAAAGNVATFEVITSKISSAIAGIVGVIITTYLIPLAWEAAIAALVETEYYNIRTSMENANAYFEAA